MQQAILGSGQSHYMRQGEFAGVNRSGGLKSCYRWVVFANDGKRICQGMNPKQCFAKWREVTKPTTEKGT